MIRNGKKVVLKMELTLNNNFNELSSEETELINGGVGPIVFAACCGGLGVAAGVCLGVAIYYALK